MEHVRRPGLLVYILGLKSHNFSVVIAYRVWTSNRLLRNTGVLEGGRSLLVRSCNLTPPQLHLMTTRMSGQHRHLCGECRTVDVRLVLPAPSQSFTYTCLNTVQLLGHPVPHLVSHRVDIGDDWVWHWPGGHRYHVHTHHSASRPRLGTRNQNRDGEHALGQRGFYPEP